MGWQTHRRTRSTYDVNPVETDNFPGESGWYDICPLPGMVDDWRSYSNPASDHPHKAISLDSARGARAGLQSPSLEENSAGHGEGGPTAPHLASASGLVAESAGNMGGREDRRIDVGRSTPHSLAASAAIAVCKAFASPTEAAAVDWESLIGTAAAANAGQHRKTALRRCGSVSVSDPVGSVGQVSRT